MANNQGLTAVNRAKKDEFYTSYDVIQSGFLFAITEKTGKAVA